MEGILKPTLHKKNLFIPRVIVGRGLSNQDKELHKNYFDQGQTVNHENKS